MSFVTSYLQAERILEGAMVVWAECHNLATRGGDRSLEGTAVADIFRILVDPQLKVGNHENAVLGLMEQTLEIIALAQRLISASATARLMARYRVMKSRTINLDEACNLADRYNHATSSFVGKLRAAQLRQRQVKAEIGLTGGSTAHYPMFETYYNHYMKMVITKFDACGPIWAPPRPQAAAPPRFRGGYRPQTPSPMHTPNQRQQILLQQQQHARQLQQLAQQQLTQMQQEVQQTLEDLW